MSEYEQPQAEKTDKAEVDQLDLELDAELVEDVRGGFNPQPDPPGKPLKT